MNRLYLIGGATIAAVALAATLLWDAGSANRLSPLNMSANAAEDDAAEESGPVTPEQLAARGYAIGDIPLGNPDAPVMIIEYASLTCPHCANFHTESLPELKANYIDTGKAQLVMREVYFDQTGLWATAVARCGGPLRYHGLIDIFLSTQADWAFSQDPNIIVGELRRIGEQAGLTQERVDECLTDEAFMLHLLETYQTHREADGVSSTPYFLINGEPVRGARSAQEMGAVIDALSGE